MVKLAGGKTAVTDASADGLKIGFISTKVFSETTVTTIYLPLNTSTSSNYQFFVMDSNKRIDVSSNTAANTVCDTGAGDGKDISTVTNIAGALSGSSSGLGSITITYTVGVNASDTNLVVPATEYFCVSLLQADASNAEAGVPKTPLVSSNKSTYYEIWIKTENVGTGTEV